MLAFALFFVVAWVFLSKPTTRRRSAELHFSKPDFVFVNGSLICISRELTLYFSPKYFISQCGILLEPAVRFAFSKGAKSIRIKFPKPRARFPTMEIICCSARPNLMPQNGSRRPLQSLKTDEHPPNEDLFFGRLLGNSFEDDHCNHHNHQHYHHHNILPV